jgi:surface antigen
MSSITGKITKSLIASASVAGMLLAGVTSANADPRWRNDGWRGGPAKKVVIVHKQRDVRPYRNYRARPAKVVHVYHNAPVYRPRPVKVVHHYETRRPDPRIVFSSETGGAILGGVIGAVAGTQIGKGSGRIAAVIGGTVLGAVIGGHIGRSMDERDHATVQESLESTPTGRVATWKNPDTGAEYSMRPTRTYRKDGRDCRDYETWAFIDGYEQKVTGTACRLADGTWQTLNT